MARDLADMLDVELNQADIIPEKLRSDSVRECLKSMMNVIEETLKFIAARMNDYSLGKSIIQVIHRPLIKETKGNGSQGSEN